MDNYEVEVNEVNENETEESSGAGIGKLIGFGMGIFATGVAIGHTIGGKIKKTPVQAFKDWRESKIEKKEIKLEEKLARQQEKLTAKTKKQLDKIKNRKIPEEPKGEETK